MIAGIAAYLAVSLALEAVPPVRIVMWPSGGANCSARIDGKTMQAQSEVVMWLISRVNPKRDIQIVSIGNTPNRCIGSLIYALRRAGFRRIGITPGAPPR
jgi:hypothetical protein